MRKLTLKQQRFVEEYLVDLNATQAAIRAGYSPKTAASQGERLLRNVEIQAAIQAAMKDRQRRTQITADQILSEVALIALFPLGGELVKTAEKLKALELAGKHLALWTDKQQVSGDGGGPLTVVIKSYRDADHAAQ